MPMPRRPVWAAATTVVPLPQNGSSTVPSGGQHASMSSVSRASGFLCRIADTFARHVVDGRNIENVGGFLHLSTQTLASCRDARRFEVVVRSIGVEQNVVMLSGEAPGRGPTETVVPDDVVHERFAAEQFIEQHADVVRCSPVDMHEDGGVRRQHALDRAEALAQEVDVRRHSRPRIVIGPGEVTTGAAGIERRIKIDALDARRRQCRQHIEAITSTQLNVDRSAH